MKSWLTTPLEWSDFRAFIALPATLVAVFMLLPISVFFLIALLSPLLPVAALCLLCLVLVGYAFVFAWADLSSKSTGRRSRAGVRILAIVILFIWLLVDLARYPFFKRFASSGSSPYPWGFLPDSFLSGHWGFATSLLLLIEVMEWTTLITTVWLLIELLLPINMSLGWRVPHLARGWAIVVLLVGFVGMPLAMKQYQTYRFINSSDSIQLRTFGPGTIGEALCKTRDVPSAQDRVGRLGAAVKDDELRWLVSMCSANLTFAQSEYDIGLNAKLIGLMARLLVMHKSTVAAHRYCGEEDQFLQQLYDTFVPEYLISAKGSGLPMDCFARPRGPNSHPWRKGQEVDAIPLWWGALVTVNVWDRSGGRDRDLEFWRKRIDVLKRLGLDIRQKSLQGRDALSGIDMSRQPTSPLIGILVDEGLDVNAPSDVDGIPLIIRLMYWRHGTRVDDPEVLRLSEKIGDPPVAQLERRLWDIPMDTNWWNDDQLTLLWTWIATQVGPKAAVGVLIGHADSTQRPKLSALSLELLYGKSKGQQ